MYIKAISTIEDLPAARSQWLVEVTEVRRQKFFPKNYAELQARLEEYGEYQTPLPVPPLDEDYDWEGPEYTALAFITVRQLDGIWFHVLLTKAAIFVMNDAGDTIDKLSV